MKPRSLKARRKSDLNGPITRRTPRLTPRHQTAILPWISRSLSEYRLLASVQRHRVFGLVQADVAASRQFHSDDGAPAGLLYLGERHAFLREGGHFGRQVVAHEEEFV